MFEATRQPIKSGSPTRTGSNSWNHLLTLRAPLLVTVLYRTDAAMYKYMYCSAGQKEELYNLTGDPSERNNLIDTEPSLLQQMRAELQRSKSD